MYKVVTKAASKNAPLEKRRKGSLGVAEEPPYQITPAGYICEGAATDKWSYGCIAKADGWPIALGKYEIDVGGEKYRAVMTGHSQGLPLIEVEKGIADNDIWRDVYHQAFRRALEEIMADAYDKGLRKHFGAAAL